jgi:hypothetical protein
MGVPQRPHTISPSSAPDERRSALLFVEDGEGVKEKVVHSFHRNSQAPQEFLCAHSDQPDLLVLRILAVVQERQ